MILGATREFSCIDAHTGAPLGRAPAPRAVGAMTPLGLARIQGDGTLTLHELGQGDVLWSTSSLPASATTPRARWSAPPACPGC